MSVWYEKLGIVIQLTGLETSIEPPTGFGKLAGRALSNDCLLTISIALCSLINLLLISLCSCFR
jgi:hypothetical protein